MGAGPKWTEASRSCPGLTCEKRSFSLLLHLGPNDEASGRRKPQKKLIGPRYTPRVRPLHAGLDAWNRPPAYEIRATVRRGPGDDFHGHYGIKLAIDVYKCSKRQKQGPIMTTLSLFRKPPRRTDRRTRTFARETGLKTSSAPPSPSSGPAGRGAITLPRSPPRPCWFLQEFEAAG